MKILQIIKEEVVPLNSRQNLILLILVACIFQFALFYAPALADDAVKQAENQETAADQADQAPIMAPRVTSGPVVNRPEPKPIKILSTSTHTITAYNSDVAQTDSDPCTTANGFNVCRSGKEDTIAANFLPFGAKVMIPELFGEKVFVVRDRMNRRHANRVDVWMKDYDDAIHFGVKVAKIQVIE